MRNRTIFSTSLLGAICLAGATQLGGCCSLEATQSHVTGETHAVIQNCGWKLFNWIPLFSGNATSPKERRCSVAFFRNDVKPELLLERMQEYAADNQLTLTDLTYHYDETVMFEMPMFGVVLPVPYIICKDELQLSGVMK